MTEPSRPLTVVSPFQAAGEDHTPTPAPAAVPDRPQPRERTGGIPDFEGKTVAATAAKVTSVAGLEIDDQAWRMDDYVRMVIEARVVKVEHAVNEKTGDLIRVHTIKAVDSKVLGWDSDPS